MTALAAACEIGPCTDNSWAIAGALLLLVIFGVIGGLSGLWRR